MCPCPTTGAWKWLPSPRSGTSSTPRSASAIGRRSMPHPVRMPKLGLTMEEGTVVAWLVEPGQTVEAGQPLLEIETDKVVVEVEAPASGILGPALVAVGERLPVGTVLAHIYAEGEPIAERAPVRAPSPRPPTPPPEPPSLPAQRAPTPAASRPTPAAGRIFSSPRARKRARELGVDWRTLSGSGPRGRIIERDVLRHVQRTSSPAPTSAPGILLQATVQPDALFALHRQLGPHIRADGGLEPTMADWLALAVAHTLAADRDLLAALWPGSDEIGLGLLELDEHATVSAMMLPLRAGLGTVVQRRQAAQPASTDSPLLLLLDLSRTRIDSLSMALPPPHPALLALGRLQAAQAALTLAARPNRLPLPLAVRLLEQVCRRLDEPYLLINR
ncbi:MAG: biotin/lipoyl-binding protein [Caldilineae bacterium]|nr:MAG: biotin/lipoyl-binding protein [Caldilineae bacterium]